MTLQETRRSGPRIVRDRADDARSRRNASTGFEKLLKSPAIDFYGLIIVGTLLVVIGLVMVLSATSVENIAADRSPFQDFVAQARFALMGLPFVVAGAFLPVSFYQRLAWPALLGALVLQGLVFTPLGHSVNGNLNWIKIGGFTMQPSELVKLALALWLGSVLAAKRHLLNQWVHLAIPVVPVVGITLGLVVLGKDLGTTMVLCILVAGALWTAGVPKRVFALGAGAAGVGVLALVITSPNRISRITAWASGDCDTQGACYQSYHGLQGLAEGGWWGVGLGASRQKWGLLPHANNDYIFAIVGEELGLAGTLSVVVLFALLAIICARLIGRHPDPFVKITTAGIGAWILGQALVNMSVVTGLLPVIGVPLPFVSAGGSALVVSMLALGVLLAFARNEPGARETIGASARSLRGTSSVVDGGGPAPVRSGAASRKATGKTSRKRRTHPAQGVKKAPKDATTATQRRGRAKR